MAKSIYERIEMKALKDAQEIIRLGQIKAKQIEDEILASTRKNIENDLERARLRAEEILKIKTIEIEQKIKQQKLLKKNELMDSTFAFALERLSQFDDLKLLKLFKKLLISENLKGDEILYVNKNDYSRYLKLFSNSKGDEYVLLDKLNKELGDPKYQLRLANEPVQIKGGLIVVGETYDVDLSFENILNLLREKYEIEIALLLFERGE